MNLTQIHFPNKYPDNEEPVASTRDDDDDNENRTSHITTLTRKGLAKPHESPDKALERKIATVERRRLQEMELQLRNREKEVLQESESDRHERESHQKQTKLRSQQPSRFWTSLPRKKLDYSCTLN